MKLPHLTLEDILIMARLSRTLRDMSTGQDVRDFFYMRYYLIQGYKPGLLLAFVKG